MPLLSRRCSWDDQGGEHDQISRKFKSCQHLTVLQGDRCRGCCPQCPIEWPMSLQSLSGLQPDSPGSTRPPTCAPCSPALPRARCRASLHPWREFHLRSPPRRPSSCCASIRSSEARREPPFQTPNWLLCPTPGLLRRYRSGRGDCSSRHGSRRRSALLRASCRILPRRNGGPKRAPPPKAKPLRRWRKRSVSVSRESAPSISHSI